VRIHQTIPGEGKLYNIVTRAGHAYQKVVLDAFNAHRILYCMWERETIYKMDVDAMNRVGQVWTGCGAGARMLERSGVEKQRIRVVPVPWFPDDPLLKPRGDRLPGVPRFYHIGKWEPRKNQAQLIRAFLHEFKPGEAKFFLKTTAGGPVGLEGYYESPAHAILEAVSLERQNGWTSDNVSKGVVLLTNMMPAARLADLHRLCDIYVTASHGEGFDMPALDAKLVGNRLVYSVGTGCGAEVAGVCDAGIDPSGTVECHEWYGWKGCSWLDYRLEDVARAMRGAWKSWHCADRVDHMWHGTDRGRRFSATHVGELMRQAVLELGPALRAAS
jgi:glycosyltransferase involved in cell wall biosynthesis